MAMVATSTGLSVGMMICKGVAVGLGVAVEGVSVAPRRTIGNGVRVAVGTASHHALGGDCVGVGVCVGVPV